MQKIKRAHLDTMSGQPAMVLIGKQHVSQLRGLVGAARLEVVQVAVGALQPSKAVHDGRNIDDAGGGCSYQLWLKQPRQSKRAQVICLRQTHTMLVIIGSVALFLPSTIMLNASFGSPAVCSLKLL